MKTQNIDIKGSMVTLTLSKDNISEDGNQIRNVTILSSKSLDKNGKVVRRFSDKALNEAVDVFNGALARLDHDRTTKQPRGVATAYGVYSDIRREGDLILGTLNLWDCDTARKVKSIAERTPTVVGNSIHAGGMGYVGPDGVEIIESVLSRTKLGFKPSVDLVDDPAATLNLFEDKNNGKDTDMEFKDLTLEILVANRPDLITQVVESDKSYKELVQAENDLRKQVDEFRVKEVMESRQKIITKVVGEVKLPEIAVTDAFKKQLNDIQESKMDAFETKVRELCEDRKTLLAASAGGVRGNGDRGNTGKETNTTDTLADILLSK